MPAPSAQDLYEQFRAELIRIRSDLRALPGDTTDMVGSGAVAMADLIIGFTAQSIAETYLDGAEFDALTRLARDHWGVERDEDVKAAGQVTFSHTAGPTGSIPAGTRVATQPDDNGDFQVFTTDAILTFGALDASLSVAATAQDPGRDGNVAAATVVRILDTLFASGFTVTNAEKFAGGAEDQTDQELREEVRAFTATLRRGTFDALEFGAKQVPTVRVATATEDPDTGAATVYVTDADGNSNAEMINDVIIVLEEWRAAGASVQVQGGALIEQSISVSLTVRAGSAIADLVDRVRAAIVSAVGRLRIGETLYRSLIQAAARAVDADNILEVEVITPAANVAPSANQVIRTSTSLVAVA